MVKTPIGQVRGSRWFRILTATTAAPSGAIIGDIIQNGGTATYTVGGVSLPIGSYATISSVSPFALNPTTIGNNRGIAGAEGKQGIPGPSGGINLQPVWEGNYYVGEDDWIEFETHELGINFDNINDGVYLFNFWEDETVGFAYSILVSVYNSNYCVLGGGDISSTFSFWDYDVISRNIYSEIYNKSLSQHPWRTARVTINGLPMYDNNQGWYLKSIQMLWRY